MFRSLFIAFCSVLSVVSSLSCKDETGNSVASWEILKFPQSTTYIYSTNSVPSQYDLNSTTEGALAYTMQQLWSSPQPQYVMYNDEPPYSTTYNFSVAHAKAIFFWDSETAVAIFHSIPRFPVSPLVSSEYIGLLSNAWEYAQHLVCVSMSPTVLSTILPVLGGMAPEVYAGTLPVVGSLPSGACVYTPLGDRMLITKAADYEVDIWSTCVAEYFSSPMQVISWVHGTREGPVCNQTVTTTDITEISYSFGTTYSDYQNHAKWGIGAYPLVCFGDLNRVTTQMARSGSILCWKDSALFGVLSGAIASTDSCSNGV